MKFDLYVQRVQKLLQVKSLPFQYEPIVLAAWECDWTPEMAADDCMLHAMGAYDDETDPKSGGGQ